VRKIAVEHNTNSIRFFLTKNAAASPEDVSFFFDAALRHLYKIAGLQRSRAYRARRR
jgi:hypothetical protein